MQDLGLDGFSSGSLCCPMFVWQTEAVLDLNLELSHAVFPLFLLWPPSPALPHRRLLSTLLCPWREGDGSPLQTGPGLLSQLWEQPHLSSLQHRGVSWKLIFEMEIRTVKGRESWPVEIFRSNHGKPQHNPERACVPGMASCRLLFRSHFVNFFASFSM